MDEVKQGQVLDLRGVLCPMNWVCAKLALEEMSPGEVLTLILDDGEPLRNVPRSAKEDGHRITGVERLKEGAYRLTVRRGVD